MLPVDSRQVENVKGELLKLTKKETAILKYGKMWPGQKKQKNKIIADCQPWSEYWVCVSLPHFFSPPGNDALFDIARATPGHVFSQSLMRFSKPALAELKRKDKVEFERLRIEAQLKLGTTTTEADYSKLPSKEVSKFLHRFEVIEDNSLYLGI
ncbi:hypothetical protein AVEN_103348-1 [Araneus ventricosus]|uniref:Uncharacterized protein n=1 Tax=Araneus ventricosus TaxID=182803 RepID=A0A4Y2KA32_ARAVE|nr:hypothetical protein AVEN_103348-1 [Araneus ventricosus]